VEDRKQLFSALAKDFGRLDIVFVNAGSVGRTPTSATDEAALRISFTPISMLLSSVNSAVPMLNDNGSIIFLSGCSVMNGLSQVIGPQSVLV
jgi:NAD(P)-dependent dehydrogenase (short-subunit alcohol dehydrogenase family)